VHPCSIDPGRMSRPRPLRSQAAATLSFLLLTVACGKSASSTSPSTRPSPSSSLVSVSPSFLGTLPSFTVPGGVGRGEAVTLEGDNSANFAGKANVAEEKSVTIDIVPAGLSTPTFSPTFLFGSPGQQLRVTVYQPRNESAHFQHNFSVPTLGIDRDIPIGAGHKITVMVTFPDSGALIFFCKYHLREGHAGAFVSGGP